MIIIEILLVKEYKVLVLYKLWRKTIALCMTFNT